MWFRLCFCVHYPGESPGHVATLAHGIKWCTRPRDTSKCMVLHQDQLPTLPMERERAFNYSIAFANTGMLWLRPLKPMQSYHQSVLNILYILSCTRPCEASNGVVLPQDPKYQLCRWKGDFFPLWNQQDNLLAVVNTPPPPIDPLPPLTVAKSSQIK